jgi:hypothetical protein
MESLAVGGLTRRVCVPQVGPSSDRQAKIDALMNKLRQRGSIGDSSLTEEASSQFAPKEEAVEEDEELVVRPPAALGNAPASWLVGGSESTASAVDAPAAGVERGSEPAAASVQELPATESGRRQSTSGIGGTWYAGEAQKESKHKPSKSGSWGVFERPDDISKAYGGGRKIGVGGYQPNEEELAAKREETERRLKAYRKDQGADLELEEAHRKEILVAQKEVCMRR